MSNIGSKHTWIQVIKHVGLLHRARNPLRPGFALHLLRCPSFLIGEGPRGSWEAPLVALETSGEGVGQVTARVSVRVARGWGDRGGLEAQACL